MAKKKVVLGPALQAWVDARRRHRLSHAQVQMARELGMNPKKLGKLDNHTQEPWKLPLREFIEHLYEKRFGKSAPDVVQSIEERAGLLAEKKAARREARAAAREAASAASEEAPALLVAPLVRDRFSLGAFAAVQVAIDLEPAWHPHTGAERSWGDRRLPGAFRGSIDAVRGSPAPQRDRI